MRAILVAILAILGIALVAVQALSVAQVGELPFGFHRIDANQRVVTWVSPEAARAGLHAGDRYDLSRATPKLRYLEIPPGDALELPVIRGDTVAPVRLIMRPRGVRDRTAQYADALLKLFGFGIALLLVARGRGRFGFFAGLFLFGVAAREGFGVRYAVLGWPISIVAQAMVGVLTTVPVYFGIEAMIALCAPALKRWEVPFFRAVVLAASVPIVVYWGMVAAAALGNGPAPGLRVYFVGHLVIILGILAGYAIALVRARLRERDLLAWIFWTSLIGWSGGICNVALGLLGRPAPAYGALNLTLFVMAGGYAYVSLRFRVVNLSFIANRAVVYGAVLAIVVAVFTIAETAITRLALSKVDSMAIDLALALAVAFSLKPAERRVDRVVERLLFARKHAIEEGLRQLISDCPHVDDATMLLQNVCEEARRLIGADHVIAYERLGDAVVPVAASPAHETLVPVSINDPVVVRMRSSLAPVVLGTMRSTIGTAGTAFPMLSRGRMLGALVCGDKSGDRAYDPDVRTLLTHLAHEVGASLLFLRTDSMSNPSRADEPPSRRDDVGWR